MMSPTGAAAWQDDDRNRRQLAEFEAALMEATRLVKFAKFDAATALLDRLAPMQPEDSRIHFARGLIAQRLGDVAGAIAHFMAAAACQPVLDQASENVGVLLRASINPVRPALPAPIADNETFIYVIGSSYARSFGVGRVMAVSVLERIEV